MVDLDPRRLSLLCELDRRGSVTAVARAVHLTPTAVSQQLKVLEGEAGATLLGRVGRGVALTEAGEALVRAAHELDVARARVEAAWDTYRHQVAGTVSLSVYPTGGQALLAGVLRRLAVHPDLHLDVSEADRQSEEYAARADEVDVVLAHRASVDASWAAVARSAARSGRRLEVVELATEPLDVAAPADHAVAALDAVEVADVADDPWIGVPVGWPFDRALSAWFADAGLEPRVVHRFTDLRLQEALVRGGHGLALLPRRAADPATGHLVVRRVRGAGPVRRIAALARADRAARVAVRVVLDALVAEAAEVPGWDPPDRRAPA